VPCRPRARFSFLAILLLASIGGFRPKALQKIRYRQITISVVKDCRSEVRLVIAKIRVRKVKKRQGTAEEWYV
jgi:hypothetical protein